MLPDAALVALGWQGLLRDIVPNAEVTRRPPSPSALLKRADLIGVGADDLGPDADLPSLGRLLGPEASVVLTRSASGGLLLVQRDGGLRPARRYPAIPVSPRDPTGAGDVFLAALVAARLGAGPGPMALPRGEAPASGGPPSPEDLRFAATVAGLAVEGLGLNGVPDASAVRRRLRHQIAARR